MSKPTAKQKREAMVAKVQARDDTIKVLERDLALAKEELQRALIFHEEWCDANEKWLFTGIENQRGLRAKRKGRV